jgi:hypothetical protein
MYSDCPLRPTGALQSSAPRLRHSNRAALNKVEKAGGRPLPPARLEEAVAPTCPRGVDGIVIQPDFVEGTQADIFGQRKRLGQEVVVTAVQKLCWSPADHGAAPARGSLPATATPSNPDALLRRHGLPPSA